MEWRGVVAVLAGLALTWLALVALLWIVRPRDVRLAELVRVVPDIVRLCRSLVTGADVPLDVRAATIGLLLWLVNPIDLVPEFIPVLGPFDDVLMAVLVLRYARRRLGDEKLRRRWPGTDAGYRLLASVLGGAAG
ncbi:MAG TPA: YkvA family protein [Candidatus Limnocylindria bacterium]